MPKPGKIDFYIKKIIFSVPKLASIIYIHQWKQKVERLQTER